MRAPRGFALVGLGLIASAALACGDATRDGAEPVRLVASEWSPANGDGPVALQWLRDGHRTRLEAEALRPSAPGWREWRLREASGDAPVARLALASDEAALLLHAASRSRMFGFAIEPNRLVRLSTLDGVRLALWLDVAPEPSLVASTELPTDEAARLVAVALSLGGWRAVANDRYPVAADGAARLPLFKPAPLADWRALRQRSLEFFLPRAIGHAFVTRPGFRAARDRALSRYAQELPRLAASVGPSVGDEAGPELGEVVAAVAAQLQENAGVFAGYLDSVWIELLIERSSSDAARVRILVHSVAGLHIEALYAELPGKVLVTESAALAALRLAPTGEGDGVRPHLGKDRLELRIDRSLEPAAQGVDTFRSGELEYALTGLAALGPNAAPLLAGLRVRATNEATGAPLSDDQVQRWTSVAAGRFGIGEEPGIDAFLAALPRVLLRDDGATPASLRLDRRTRTLALPAGAYRLVADFVPPAEFGLVLEAGVVLRVDPGHSLLIRGPLQARGRAQRPVRVQAAKPAEPWGVLALQGRGRSRLREARPRSVLQHFELSGGSRDHLKGVAYEGQLSVHHQDLSLEHAVLSRAFAGAALSVKHGEVDLRNAVFVDNASDAVVLDHVAGRVEACFFGRSAEKGDGLELSGSSLEVADSVFGGLRDECVSLRAASTLALRGSLLRDCEVGLAAREGSRAEVTESLFLGNGRSFSATAKRAGFGGGAIRGRRLLLVAASRSDRRDEASSIALDDATAIADPAEVGIALEGLRSTPTFSGADFRSLAPAPRGAER